MVYDFHGIIRNAITTVDPLLSNRLVGTLFTPVKYYVKWHHRRGWET